MRTLSEPLTAHLQGAETTLCACWIITRRDGVKLGFTDHDRALTIDATRCEPETGLTGGGSEYSSGLNADSWSADGILSSDAITDDDLRSGVYDRAVIEQWLVNWQSPDQAQRLTRALMGEVTIADNRYTIELRSVTALLDRDQTRFFAAECDAELGDSRCGVDVHSTAVAATVVATGDNNRLTLQTDEAIDPALFHDGNLALADGTKARMLEISQAATGQQINLVLDRSLAGLQPGAGVALTQGCDKRFSTCKSRFANATNFRGFPHIPGGENALGYADEEGEYNGEPLVR